MAKKRFVQDSATGELYEVTPDYQSTPRSSADGLLWNDRHYNDLKATDGTDISSRSKHREYMKRHGLTTADDFSETWKVAAQKRADYFQGKGGGAVTRDDVARAIHQLENRR